MIRRPRAALPLLLAVGALVALAGCPKNNGRPDGGTGTADFTICSLDTECDPGFRCHRELRRCVCTSDQSCPAGLFCNSFTGRCVVEVPGCTSDAQCSANQYCEIGTRTCRTRRQFCEPCTEDVQCGTSTDRCLLDSSLGRSFCGKACSGDGDCPQGATCQDRSGNQSCWPAASTCEALAGCTPDTGQACGADADCTEGSEQICDQVQGACVARVPTCPFGQVCDRDARVCTAACSTDDDCNLDPDCEGTPCRCTNNQCIPILLCQDNDDCETGTVCVLEPGQTEGECGTACDDDGDCPQGEVCTDLGTRRACTRGCVSNGDCALSQNCSGGQCVSGCQTHEVCSLCELCRPVNAQVSQCEDTGALYCQPCTAPLLQNSCNQAGTPPYPDSWCCNIDGSTASFWGIPCRFGCPSGFDCAEIGSAQNCLPMGGTCTDPNCN